MPTSPRWIDPALTLALSDAEKGTDPLNVFLKISFPSDVTSADARARKAADLIRRVEKTAGTTSHFQFRALDNVLHVKAPAAFLRQLIGEPEVITASAVPPVESAMITPFNRREVDDNSVDHPVAPPHKTNPRSSR